MIVGRPWPQRHSVWHQKQPALLDVLISWHAGALDVYLPASHAGGAVASDECRMPYIPTCGPKAQKLPHSLLAP